MHRPLTRLQNCSSNLSNKNSLHNLFSEQNQRPSNQPQVIKIYPNGTAEVKQGKSWDLFCILMEFMVYGCIILFFTIILKGDKLCNFLFTSLDDLTIHKGVYSWKNLLPGEQTLLFTTLFYGSGGKSKNENGRFVSPYMS